MLEEITLRCLMNKEYYNKYLNSKDPIKREKIEKDKKFYRKRICDLTKQLLLNDNPPEINLELKSTFENYSISCINYFKNLDKTDIIQNDYLEYNNVDNTNNIEINGEEEGEGEEKGDIENSNKLFMRSIKVNEPNTLEKFIKRKSTKVVTKMIIPMQKNINLKDPLLKNKGIRKKNNITNKYDEKVIEEKDIEKEKI